jgi:hypothetical protein
MSILAMAEAHVENVKQKIIELQAQKNMIDTEMVKLSNYLKDCQTELSKEVTRDNVVSE